MGAFAMAAKIEEQHIEAMRILQRGYWPQPHTRGAVAVADDHGWRRLGLRPEFATQQWATGRPEGEWTLEHCRRLRRALWHSPASSDLHREPRLVQLLMRSGKLVYEAI